MKKYWLIIIASVGVNLTAKAQNLFIIGERSYPCTDEIMFESDADECYNLEVFLAKEGEFSFLAVSRKCSAHGEEFTGKLILYLDNGSVITCNESEISEKVGDLNKALYALTTDQLNKLKINNIQTVKYSVLYGKEELYLASNWGVETNVVISEFFDPTEKLIEIANSADSLKSTDVEVIEEKPFAYVEQMPSFPDGTEAMYRYIYNSLNYPTVARANGVAGQVIIQFTISAEGEIQEAKVVRGIGSGCDEEALRVVNSMPTWNPGKHNGRNVPVRFTLPIKFVL